MSAQGMMDIAYFVPDSWEIFLVASKFAVVSFLCALDVVSKF